MPLQFGCNVASSLARRNHDLHLGADVAGAGGGRRQTLLAAGKRTRICAVPCAFSPRAIPELHAHTRDGITRVEGAHPTTAAFRDVILFPALRERD